MLKRFKRKIRWAIADIIGIPSDICSHKIQTMPDHKPSIEHQRRLNPLMQEVVKKEIIKWLHAGVIYPFADSSWLCYVECVPKKGRITVVMGSVQVLLKHTHKCTFGFSGRCLGRRPPSRQG